MRTQDPVVAVTGASATLDHKFAQPWKLEAGRSSGSADPRTDLIAKHLRTTWACHSPRKQRNHSLSGCSVLSSTICVDQLR